MEFAAQSGQKNDDGHRFGQQTDRVLRRFGHVFARNFFQSSFAGTFFRLLEVPADLVPRRHGRRAQEDEEAADQPGAQAAEGPQHPVREDFAVSAHCGLVEIPLFRNLQVKVLHVVVDEAADEEHQAVAEEEKRRQRGARFDHFTQFSVSVGESVVFDHLVPALRFANSLLPLVVGVFQRDDAERYYERREEHEGAE